MSVQGGGRGSLFAATTSMQEVCDVFTDPPAFQRFKAAARQEHEAWKRTKKPKRVVDPSAPRPRFTVELHV